MNQARMQKRNRRKKAALAVAAVLALALAGTFAWANYTQTALNEAKSSAQPGGRLHDDFTFKTAATSNKDVYVENFNDPDSDDGVPVYARVRFLEYMEKGPGATDGTNNASPVTDTGEKGSSTAVGVSPSLSDKDSWTLHKYPSAAGGTHDDAFSTFWDWDYAGSTFYMPTYNKNKDSFEADINGSMSDTRYDAVAGTINDPYCNYRSYASEGIPDDCDDGTGDGKREAYYDNDANLIDESNGGTSGKDGAGGIPGTNYYSNREQHSSKKTLDSEVISMAEWQEDTANGGKGKAAGNFWVYDTDGWAYWANPIKPGEATGLLLDNIAPKAAFGEDWYYGIEAQAQFASYGEWSADRDDPNLAFTTTTGTNGTAITAYGSTVPNGMTKEAWDVLDAAKEKDDSAKKVTYRLTLTPNVTAVNPGGTVTFGTKLEKTEGGTTTEVESQPAYTWTVDPASSGEFTADTKTLQVNSDAPAGKLKVTAAGTTADGKPVTSYVELTVNAASAAPAGTEDFAGKGLDASNPPTVRLDTNGDGKVDGSDSEFLYLDKRSSTDLKIADGSPVDNVGSYGLVMLKTPDKTTKVKLNSSVNTPRWKGSVAQNWCKTDFYGSLPNGIKELIPQVTLTTSRNGNQGTSDVDVTEDFVFYLSEADMFNTTGGRAVTNPDLYTGRHEQLITDPNVRKITTTNSATYWYWLRSAYNSDRAAGVTRDGSLGRNSGDTAAEGSPRPCFWVYLGPSA